MSNKNCSMFMATTKSYPNLHILRKQPDNRANMLVKHENLAFHSDIYDQNITTINNSHKSENTQAFCSIKACRSAMLKCFSIYSIMS